MSGPHEAKVVHAGEGKRIAAAGDLYTFLAEGEDTSRSYALWEAVVPPGGGPPPHVQSREDEGFYVLEGEITFVADGRKLVAHARHRRSGTQKVGPRDRSLTDRSGAPGSAGGSKAEARPRGVTWVETRGTPAFSATSLRPKTRRRPCTMRMTPTDPLDGVAIRTA